MQERFFLKLALIISILGLFNLLVISYFIKAEKVNSYADLKLNNHVFTKSRIISIKNYDDFSVMKLENNITAVCSCRMQENISIEVKGGVEEYNQELQINADKIIQIS